MPWPHMVESIITFEPGSFSVAPSKPERIADAVARNAGGEAALLGSIDRGGDVDAEAQIGILHSLDEILGRDAIVEHRGHRCRTGQAVDHALKIRRDVAIPVRGRIHVLATDEAPRHESHRPD